jgi:hypothetical protein
MIGDIHEMKQALTSIAESLKNLSAIEQRQLHLNETTSRAHSRIDGIESLLKEEVKGHEKRLQSIEIQIAKNAWIERAITAVFMAVIVVWAKGGL